MAVWQFKFTLVPKVGILRVHGEVPAFLEEFMPMELPATVEEIEPLTPEELEALSSREFTNYWEESGTSAIEEDVKLLLPFRTDWGVREYGEDAGNEVWVSSDFVECRLTLTQFDEGLAREFLRLANKYDCLIASDTGEVIPADWTPFVRRIRMSRAAKFVRDPIVFLTSLSD